MEMYDVVQDGEPLLYFLDVCNFANSFGYGAKVSNWSVVTLEGFAFSLCKKMELKWFDEFLASGMG